jgi:hypothetical protein
MSVQVVFGGRTLALYPDPGFNYISLGNDGNGNITGVATGFGPFSSSGVDQVIISAKGRHCQIVYGQSGDQIRPFSLDAEEDATIDFTVNMYGHAVRSDLFLRAFGGPGHNTFSVNAAGVNVLAGTFGVYLVGGDGPDTISMLYEGVKSKNAKLDFTALSGRDGGNDITVQAAIRSDPSEDNLPAGPNDCGFLVGDPGDRGRDTGNTNLFTVRLDSDLPLSTGSNNPGSMVQGGRGPNLAFVTPNVTVSGCQVLPADAFNGLIPRALLHRHNRF